MKRFLAQHASKITGVLSGFDRILFRGTLRQLAHLEGLLSFLRYQKVLLKDFARYAQGLTERVKASSLALATASARPVRYLSSNQLSKEDIARQILLDHPIHSGLVCILTAVEPCMSYEIYRNRETKRLELQPRQRKCLFHYHYFVHPQFGFGHARIQTWLPFSVQICLNGREWLGRQLAQAGVTARREENCFTWISDCAQAQALMDEQLRLDWPRALDELVRLYLHPGHATLFGSDPQQHYWSLPQSEWATDVLFKDSSSLAAIYPSLIHHAITSFTSRDVLRFLGKRVHSSFPGQILSDFKDRPEGVRIKHSVGHNSVKIYDKQGSVLRVETTIHDPRDLKVYRGTEGNPDSPMRWRPLRKGVADLHRRAQLSQACNERYLEALATHQCSTPLGELLRRLCKPTRLGAQRVRALRPWDPQELRFLETLASGDFLIQGLRNRDLLARLYPDSLRNPDQRKRLAASITRRLRILRAHGLIRRVQRTHRYLVTEAGREIITAILAARDASVTRLLANAA